MKKVGAMLPHDKPDAMSGIPGHAKTRRPGPVTKRLDRYRPTPVSWLVPDYLPKGKLVLLAGDGGLGKSMLTLHLAAVLSRGQPAFGLDYPEPPRGKTLLIQCEDDAADTVLPRFLAEGGEPSLVHQLQGVRDEKGKLRPFCLAQFEILSEALKRRRHVKLVVIDPAGAYVGAAGVDDHKDADLRASSAPWPSSPPAGASRSS